MPAARQAGAFPGEGRTLLRGRSSAQTSSHTPALFPPPSPHCLCPGLCHLPPCLHLLGPQLSLLSQPSPSTLWEPVCPRTECGHCRLPATKGERRRGTQCGLRVAFRGIGWEPGGRAASPAAEAARRCPMQPAALKGWRALRVTREVRAQAHPGDAGEGRHSQASDRDRVSAESLWFSTTHHLSP